MKGTEKQIAWAGKIKAAAETDIVTTYKGSNVQMNENLKIMAKCFVDHIDNASEWIDNRNKFDNNGCKWYFKAFCEWVGSEEGIKLCEAAGCKRL